ncbi:GNAT family acetyltransferase, partial [Vibrio parahaemolyticus]
GNKTDFQLISRIVSEKTPLSNILDVRESEDLLMFYVLIALKNELYYIEELDVIVLMEQEDADLYVLDILSTKKLDVVEVLRYLPIKKIETIHL